jgi:hypothetical protein
VGPEYRVTSKPCGSERVKEKGREQFWPKKGQFVSYKEKLEKWTEFTTFRVNKMFLPINFVF